MKRSESFSSTVAGVAVVSSGSIAGLMLGAGFAAYADKVLPQAAWIMQQQAKDKVYGRTMPPLSVTAAASLMGAAAFSGGHARVWLLPAQSWRLRRISSRGGWKFH